jgi:hypothetical protein
MRNLEESTPKNAYDYAISQLKSYDKFSKEHEKYKIINEKSKYLN